METLRNGIDARPTLSREEEIDRFNQLLKELPETVHALCDPRPETEEQLNEMVELIGELVNEALDKSGITNELYLEHLRQKAWGSLVGRDTVYARATTIMNS